MVASLKDTIVLLLIGFVLGLCFNYTLVSTMECPEQQQRPEQICVPCEQQEPTIITEKLVEVPAITSQNSITHIDDLNGPLNQWFNKHEKGPIVWKWTHYFQVYEELFSRFRNKKDLIMIEIGTRDGGSLLMWKHYFHPDAQIHGLDINPFAVKHNDPPKTRIFLGSQNNETFLLEALEEFRGKIDIVLDDASHVTNDQYASFKAIFPLLSRNSVYLVEDTMNSKLLTKIPEYVDELLGTRPTKKLVDEPLYSVKLYRNMIAVEKRDQVRSRVAIKKGDESIPCEFKAC